MSKNNTAQTQDRYRILFEDAPVALLEEDFSEVKKRIDFLFAEGVGDLDDYFKRKQDEILHLASLVRIIDANKKAVKLLGAESKNNVIGSLPSYFDEKALQDFREKLVHLSKGNSQFSHEVKIKMPHGGGKELSLSLLIPAQQADTWSRVIVSLVDISEQKRAEALMRENERKFCAIANYSYDWENWVAPDGRLLWLSNGVEKLTGYTPQEYQTLQDRLKQVIYEEDFDRIYDHYRGALQQKLSANDIEFRIIHKDGSLRWASVSYQSIYSENGEFVGLRSCIRDITNRKIAEQLIRDHQDELSAIYENAPLIMMVLDKDCRVCKSNRFAEIVVKNSEDKLFSCGQVLNCSHSQDHTQGCGYGPQCPQCTVRNVVNKTFETGEVANQLEAAMSIMSDGNSRNFIFLVSASRIALGGLHRVLVTMQDITEKKHAQQKALQYQKELAHASRLSTIGEMASNLAHELNQPFCAILAHTEGCIEMLKSSSCDYKKVTAKMEVVAAQAEKAGKIINHTKDLIRKEPAKAQEFDINKIIETVVEFIAAEAERLKIKIELKLDRSIPPIIGSPVQIEQVVLNLVKNSIESMEDINAMPLLLKITTSLISPAKLEVRIKDTGKGIPEENTQKIFDSFFTTKSNGLGIGLSICRSIVEAHGGKLYVSKNLDRGAEFCFNLPTIQNATEQMKQ